MYRQPHSLALSGLLPPGTQFDLFRGTAAMKQDVEDMYPTTLGHTIKVIGKSNLNFDLCSYFYLYLRLDMLFLLNY